MTELYHITLDVRLFLERATSRDLANMFCDDHGRPVPATIARNTLMQELGRGRERLPIGPKCDRFDPKFGCLGHPLE
jgi:hypothetical protein